MKEIWKASSNPDNWSEVKVSSILPLWWFFWLTYNILSYYAGLMSLGTEEMSVLKAANLLYQAFDIASIFLALVMMVLVNGVYQAQAAHANNTERQKVS